MSDNVKEMSNPTRDGRAMITSGVHTIRPDGTPVDGCRCRDAAEALGHTEGQRSAPCGYRARPRTRMPHPRLRANDGTLVQESRFTAIAALAAGLLLSACATSPATTAASSSSPANPMSGSMPAATPCRRGAARPDAARKEGDHRRGRAVAAQSGFGKIQMGEVSGCRDREFGQLLRALSTPRAHIPPITARRPISSRPMCRAAMSPAR